ncbi:MAG TPA: anti-sigma factor [Trinickia sp.]|uniref:anti-sigma factor n=1 Tax=Trinickia sp. TaxID=2571163 RepID=UPI002CF7AE24|nr:anti-sigma factor [Trinickia sp.]HVW52967.1 anti-sigma factor [Trinickia sp.]
MNLHRFPDLLDRLAGEYALGVLRGGARKRFERMAQQDQRVRAAIEAWQARIEAMPELAPSVAPPAHVWAGIERRLAFASAPSAAHGGERTAPQSSRARALLEQKRPRWFESLAFWRGWSIGATGLALAAAVALAVTLRPFAPQSGAPAEQTAQTSPSGAAKIERVAYVAALVPPDQPKSPTMALVMWDDKNAMASVHRMSGGDAPPPGKSEQLWGVMRDGRMVSLGMLPAGAVVDMKVHAMNVYVKLAVSVEPMGGSRRADGPSGPVVCEGALMATA